MVENIKVSLLMEECKDLENSIGLMEKNTKVILLG